MLTDEQRKTLDEERIRLLHARYGDSNPEVQAWVKAHGFLPAPVETVTTSPSAITVSESEPVETKPVKERAVREKDIEQDFKE